LLSLIFADIMARSADFVAADAYATPGCYAAPLRYTPRHAILIDVSLPLMPLRYFVLRSIHWPSFRRFFHAAVAAA